MGQYWVIVNLDKCESSGHMGKLGEFWASGYGFLPKIFRIPSDPEKAKAVTTGSPINLGCWAGDRLICVGDYAEEYPEGLFTKEELDTMKAKYGGSLYHLVSEDAENWPRPGQCGWRKTPALEGGWVLRNLTKEVYVKLSGLKEGNCGGVDQVLLSFISWSTDPSSAMRYDLTRGEWAGNCFDVTLLDEETEGLKDWKDVTEEVVKKLQPIWKSESYY